MKSLFSMFPLFNNLTNHDYDILETSAKKFSFSKNQIIFQKGDPCKNLYLLNSGAIKLFNTRKGSEKEEIVCVIHPNGYFCLSPLLSKKYVHITAKTLQSSEGYIIPRDIILKLIDLSHTFAKNIIQYLAQKECSLCEGICDLSLSTTKERLAKYLLSYFTISKKPSRLPFNQAQLAAHLGTVRETLSRDLSSLKKAHLIQIKQGLITILAPQELAIIAGKKAEKTEPLLQIN